MLALQAVLTEAQSGWNVKAGLCRGHSSPEASAPEQAPGEVLKALGGGGGREMPCLGPRGC